MPKKRSMKTSMETSVKPRSHVDEAVARLPDPMDPSNYRLYNRTLKETGGRFEFFLTDFIRLRRKEDLPEFMEKGQQVRRWFEQQTSWRLVLSAHCGADTTCKDDHGPQILNLWHITKGDFDSIPQGLVRLGREGTPHSKVVRGVFNELVTLFDKETHFITFSTGWNWAKPHLTAEYEPVFVYVEYWPNYGREIALLHDLVNGIDSFDAPWQFICNVRAISGRVNTFSQYWLRFVRKGGDRSGLAAQVRQEITRALWHKPDYRLQRIDLLTPSLYDPTANASKKRQGA